MVTRREVPSNVACCEKEHIYYACGPYHMSDIALLKALDAMPELNIALNELTKGRKRGYLFYFSSAKQIKTREQELKSKCKIFSMEMV